MPETPGDLELPRDPDAWYVFAFTGKQSWALKDFTVDSGIAHTMFATRIAHNRARVRMYHGHDLIAERGA